MCMFIIYFIVYLFISVLLYVCHAGHAKKICLHLCNETIPNITKNISNIVCLLIIEKYKYLNLVVGNQQVTTYYVATRYLIIF